MALVSDDDRSSRLPIKTNLHVISGQPGDGRCQPFFFLGLPFGHPPFLAFLRAAAALAGLVARPACAAKTLLMSAPHKGHFNVLIRDQYRRSALVRHVHAPAVPHVKSPNGRFGI